MFYTYLWLREDGTPYYAGKGAGFRAFKKHLLGDAPERERIILQSWDTEEEAFEAEKFLIVYYGRIDLGTGCLRNLTDGGEGTAGKSEDARRRISLAMQGNTRGKGQEFSEERRKRLREASKGNTKGRANKGRKRGHPWNFGTARSLEERRLRHREADRRWREKQRVTEIPKTIE